MRSELRCGVLFAPTGFARGSDSSRDARCDLERARERCDAHAGIVAPPFEREIARDADARARVSERDRGARRVGTPRMQKQPRPSRGRYPEREPDDDLPLSPPDMTVRPSRPPPPSPPSSRRSRSSARPPSPASLPPPCSPRCVLDSTTISPRAPRARPYPRARGATRGANGDQLCAETPSDVSSSRVSSPGRAHAPRRGSRALFPARGARFPLSLVGGSTWHSCAIFFRGAQTRPPAPPCAHL